MNARRLLDAAHTPAEQVIAQAASVAPQPIRAAGWDDVMALAVMRRPSAARFAPAFVLSFALGMGLVLLLRPTPEAPPASAGTIVLATADTRWGSAAPDEVVLQSGRLSVMTPSTTTLRVRTPDADLEVTHSRFLAEVVAGGTTIQVFEGEAVLRSGQTVRVVRAGESLTWPPAPSIPAPLVLPFPVPEPRCAKLTLDARSDCLKSETTRDSLEAQAALYELGAFESGRGSVDAGLTAWRESLVRFPRGVLHPEVRLAMLLELVKARRFAEAREAALDFEAHCAGDPRLEDVVSLRRALTR